MLGMRLACSGNWELQLLGKRDLATKDKWESHCYKIEGNVGDRNM